MNPADPFSNDFAEKFADMLNSYTSTAVPVAKKCETREELATWLRQFARACKSNLPKS